MGIRLEKANDLDVIYTEIRGPKDSNYEGGYFVIRFEFTNDYPVSSPSVAFITKLWHPNVDHHSGSVCLNSLNQNWQPTVNVRHILDTHILWLLQNGNPDDPLNTDAGEQMKAKDPKYPQIVRQWVKRHASHSQLAQVGNLWYKDQSKKKKKKKKKFSIAELNAPTTPKQSVHLLKNITPQTPQKKKIIKKRKRLSSKSMGHIDDNIDFENWWTQSKVLPNTPTKCSKPQHIKRSNSFCNRPDSSPWIRSRKPIRRMMSDSIIGWNEYYEDNVDVNSMKLISLQNYVDDDNKENMNEFHLKKYKKKRKKIKKNVENESDLSSMDEDPICDLQTYESLTPSIFKSAHTPSFNYSQHTNHGIVNDMTPKSIQYPNPYNIYSKSDSFMPEIHSFCPEFSPLSPTKSPYINSTNNQSKERILHFAPVNTQKNNRNWNINTIQSEEMSDNEEDDDNDDDMCSIKVNKIKKHTNDNHNILLQTAEHSKMSLD